MAEVLRRKVSQREALPAYALHGVTAVLALWFMFKALGA